MDMGEVKAFNAELSGLYDNKPPISKAKMSAITRGAIKAIKFYKHVVHSVEKFIQKCKPEYKVPGLYVIDSIVRQSRHQFGQDKDVFAPRFAKNMQQTFSNLFRCPPEDKRNIIRVLNLWQKNNVFSSDVIQPLLDMADPNHPLHQEIQAQQNNTANGSSLNASHNTTDKSPAAAQHTPHSSTPMGDSFQDQPSGIPAGSKFNRKLLNDFDYDSEDDAPPPDPAPPAVNPADALGSILTNPEIMRQLQSLQAQMQMMTGMQIPNLMPMMTDMQLQQNQQQNPYLTAQQDQQKQNENKEDATNESDIEFVETGPQVIEIPDANDSRSPSPRSRRPRSRSPRRRRRSRTRSRSPRRRRDRDRDRDKDRDKDREKSYKEKEADREKQKEREKKGLPPIKKENLSVCSTTLWVGHVSKLATQEELSDLFGAIGGVVSIDVVAPRGCAFVVMERRRDAYKALQKLNKHKLHSREITVAWAPGKGVKGREWKDYWEAELGVSYLPWAALHARWLLGALSLDALEDGGAVDEDTLPPWLPPRMIPKMDNMPMMGMPAPGMMPNMPNMPPGGMPNMPTGMPNMPTGAMPPTGMPGANLLPTPPGNLPMQMPRMPPPGMPTGMPPGLAPGMAGMRPPSLPMQNDALPSAPLLGFPPPHSMQQPGMVGGYLGGLLGVGGLVAAGVPLLAGPAPAQQPKHTPALTARTTEISQADDAMDLDTEDNHEESNPGQHTSSITAPPPLLSDQLQALLSKPPPAFNASEPPPGFNLNEPPPFNANQPPPSEDKPEDDRKDRDRDRRDRDRRDRDRDNRRDRGDRDRRDRDRGRDRDRDRDDRRDRDRGERDRDRGGRDRRDRDRDRGDRFANRDNNGERSREKSPRSAPAEPSNEKSLQERLWEMANGKPAAAPEPGERAPAPPGLPDRPPGADSAVSVPVPAPAGSPPGGWTQLPRAPPGLAPPFRAELRMRGPPRQSMRGPWMEGPGPGPGPGGPVPPFGPRFNGMGPPFNRPPFERPPFEGGPPLFDGPPRFERPPFNRMPFDGMNRPPFDGPRPPFDGPRPPFEPRPGFDGPRQFDAPFEGEFDGPHFDGPPEFFDRNNRRFDDREQFNDRGWNGDRDRDREWGDRRNEWDDRRRDRRSRDHEDRFRDRNDRRRNFDERRTSRDERTPREERGQSVKDDKDNKDKDNKDKDNKDKDNKDKDNKDKEHKDKPAPKEEKSNREDRNTRRDKDRKSRWGAAEETTSENIEIPQEMASIDSNSTDIKPDNTNTNEVTNKDAGDSSQTEQIQNTEPEIQTDNIMERKDSNEDKQFNQQDSCNEGTSYETDNIERNNDNQEKNEPERVPDFEIFTAEKDVANQEKEQQNEASYESQENYSRQDNNDYDTQTETSHKEPEQQTPMETAPVENVPIDNAPSLYDTNETIDTSFSVPAPSDIDVPAPIEKDTFEPQESSKTDDIFEAKEAPTASETPVENKEGVA